VIKSRPSNSLSNSGHNNGFMAGEVHGDIIINSTNGTKKLPSLIPQLIEKLAEITDLTDEEIERIYRVNIDDTTAYNINEKISYNNIIKYRSIIDEYSYYGSICDEAFNVIDNNNMGCKRKILRSITLIYKESKGQLLLENGSSGLDEIDIIRKNADRIIDEIKRTLEERIIDDHDGQYICIEDVGVGLIRIICYAFVECKILEKPRW